VYPFDQISIIYANIQNPLCNFAHVAFIQHFIKIRSQLKQKKWATYSVTTCLENLEMSGNLTAVSEMSGILLKIREKSCQGKVA